MKLGDTLKKCREFKRSQVEDLLSKCDLGQRGMFNKIFGNKISSLDEEELDNAIRLCESTIIKNESREQ